jgi:hypothetical protein
MKNIISIAISLTLFSGVSFADCQFNDLKHNADGTVTYSAADHVCVGNLVQDNATKAKQVDDLNKAITLKDLALTKSDQRVQMWQDTTFKLEDNMQKVDSLQKTSQWVWFGLGVLTTGLAVEGAAQLGRRH